MYIICIYYVSLQVSAFIDKLIIMNTSKRPLRLLKTAMWNFGILKKFALQNLSKTLCINELRTLFKI